MASSTPSIAVEIMNLCSPQFACRSLGCLQGRETPLAMARLGERLDGGELSLERGVGSRGPKECVNPSGESADCGDHDGSCSSLSTKPARRRQRLTSRSSARRPAFVMS
jgi:hypothetical protein